MIHRYKSYTPEIDPSAFLAPGSAVIGNVKIGPNSSIWHNAVIRGDIEKITIGENTNIQDNSSLHCDEKMEMKIGNNVTVGHSAVLHSCTIGDGTLVGMGAIVLNGAKIGRNCLIGPGPVVTPNSEIPDGSLVIGTPGKVKRQLSEEEMQSIKTNAGEYVRLSGEYRE